MSEGNQALRSVGGRAAWDWGERELPRFILGGGTLHALRRRLRIPRDARALALLDAAFDAGCTAIDTAAVYGHGDGEVLQDATAH